MPRQVNAPNEEPEESKFSLPSEKEHLLQIVDFWPDAEDTNIIVTRIEVVGGSEEGRSILHRVNLDDQAKGFYYTRLFLKAIGENYKGSFKINEEAWSGKQFYATVVHDSSKGKTYANINEYNFEKKIEQFDQPKKEVAAEDVAW